MAHEKWRTPPAGLAAPASVSRWHAASHCGPYAAADAGSTAAKSGPRAVNRRICLLAIAASILTSAGGLAAQTDPAGPKSAAVMNFELINEMRDYETDEASAAQQRRLGMISDVLRQELSQRGLYRIVSNHSAAALIAEQASRQDLRNCNGCELDIGRALNAEVIILGWVQKVSNLILNVNIEVKDVASGKTLYTKSVDLRGNTDTSWLRGIHYMVQSIAEKKQNLH